MSFLSRNKNGERYVDIPWALIVELQSMVYKENVEMNVFDLMFEENLSSAVQVVIDRNTPTFQNIRNFIQDNFNDQLLSSSPSVFFLSYDGSAEFNEVQTPVSIMAHFNDNLQSNVRSFKDFITGLLYSVETESSMGTAFESGVSAELLFDFIRVYSFKQSDTTGFSSSKSTPVNLKVEQVFFNNSFVRDFYITFKNKPIKGITCGAVCLINLYRINTSQTLYRKILKFIKENFNKGLNIEEIQEAVETIDSLFILNHMSILSVWKYNNLLLSYQSANKHGTKLFHFVLSTQYTGKEHWYYTDKHPLEHELTKWKCEGCDSQFKSKTNKNKHDQSCVGSIINIYNTSFNKALDIKEIKPMSIESFRKQAQDKINFLVELLMQNKLCCMLGSGGMGKTFNVKEILKQFPSHQVVAPSALAACEYVDGMTWQRWIMSKQPLPKLLVLDEVSMMTSSDLNEIDEKCRKMKDADPDSFFGGIAVLIVGDCAQLPPVVKGNEGFVFWFNHERVRKSLFDNHFVILEEPFRFITHEQDEIGFKFTNALEKLRRGLLDSWLKKTLKQKNIEIGSIDNLVYICRTNKEVSSIGKLFYSYGVNIKSKAIGDYMKVSIGQKILITDNRASNKNEVYNGKHGIIKKFVYGDTLKHKNSPEEILIQVDGKTYSIKNKNGFPFTYHDILTVHRSQGQTFDKICIVDMSVRPINGKIKQWSEGQFYTAVSRCRRIENVYIHFQNISSFNESVLIRISSTVRNFLNNPRHLLPSTVMTKDGFMVEKDSDYKAAVYKLKNKYINPQTKTPLYLYGMENHLLFMFTMFFDIETCTPNGNILTWLCVSSRFYFFGKVVTFDEFVLEISNVIELPSDFFHYLRYKILDDNSMYMSWEQTTDVSKEFFNLLLIILKIVRFVIKAKQSTVKNTLKHKTFRNYLSKNPLYLCGYNSNNFDNFGVMQQFLNTSSWSDEYMFNITPSGGSGTKGFSVIDKESFKPVLRSHDLCELMGFSSLASTFDSIVKNAKSDAYNSLLTSVERVEIPDHYDTYKLRFPACAWTHDSLCPQKLFDILKLTASRINASRKYWLDWSEKEQKKGCPPLKYLQNFTFEKFQELDIINIFELAKKDITKVFFKREESKYNEHLSEKGEEFYKNYDIKYQLEQYCKDDVLITEACYRAYNNLLYSLLKDTKKFPQGLGLSVLKFNTIASLAQFITTSLMPDYVKHKKDVTLITTKLPLYPRKFAEKFKMTPGGKVMPRQYYWKSKDDGREDYYTYLDSSGMYMAAMANHEYPYGAFKETVYEHDPEYLDDLKEKYNGLKKWNNPKEKNRLRYLFITRTAHHMDCEPAAGYRFKVGNAVKVKYQNSPNSEWQPSPAVFDIVQAKGSIHRIWSCIEWSDQGYILKKPMEYYSKKKNESKGPMKKLFKLLANASYGAQLKKESDSRIAIIKDSKEMEHALAKEIKYMVQQGDGLYVKYKDSSNMLTSQCTHMGAFVLGWSRHDQNQAICSAMGSDRFDESKRDKMIIYGDTDSMVLHATYTKKLAKSDKECDVKDRFLFLPDIPPQYKMGKLTDELADDVEKYIDKTHAKNLINQGFPDLGSGFCGRVIETLSPLPKVNFVKMIFPPDVWEGLPTSSDYYPSDTSLWTVAYKATCKGIPKDAYIWTDIEGVSHKNIIPLKFDANEECFNLIKYVVLHNKVLYTESRDRLVKNGRLDKNKINRGEKILDIISVEKLNRTLFNHKWGGREYIPNQTWTMPIGWQREPYTKSQIDLELLLVEETKPYLN